MRKQLLLSTAALLAGIAMASAQGTPGGMTGGKSPGATTGHEQPATQGRSSEPRAQEHGRNSQPQRSEQNEHRTTGQATPSAKEPVAKSPSAKEPAAKSPSAKEPATNAKEPGRAGEHAQGKPSAAPSEHERTTGQAPSSEPGRNPAQTQNRPSPNEKAAPQHEPQQTEGKAPSSTQQARPAQPQPGQPQQAERRPEAGGNVKLSSEQQSHIRDTILSRSNAPRVDNARFALSVGTMVPRDVRVVAVPEELITINPQWRDDEYFVVRDEVVIVDRGHRIVAVLPTGSGSSQAMGRGRASGSLNLGMDEIRQLQMTLTQKGFNVGEPDGRMGPRTERALMEFQQRQGLQTTGHIDQETVTALGINVREQQGGRTTGQAPAAGTEPGRTGNEPGRAGNMPKQPSANEQPMRNEPRTPGKNEPATSGQSRPMQQPSAKPGTNANPSAKPGATANPPASPGANPRTGEGTREHGR